MYVLTPLAVGVMLREIMLRNFNAGLSFLLYYILCFYSIFNITFPRVPLQGRLVT